MCWGFRRPVLLFNFSLTISLTRYPYFCNMKLWRKITAFCILLPFLFSVTGVLVYHSYCHCTGKSSVGLYVVPEGCESLLASHRHLFEHHSGDLNHACNADLTAPGEPHQKDCGCESPQMKFFKLKSHFTDEKSGISQEQLSPQEFFLMYEPFLPDPYEAILPVVFRDDLPRIPEKSGLIHFICQPKIPDLI